MIHVRSQLILNVCIVQKSFCRIHFREHEPVISNDIQPLIDRLNNLVEENLQIEEHKKLLFDELYQWQQASHRIIDDYYEKKYCEIEEKLKEYKEECQEKLQKIKAQIEPRVSNQLNIMTHDDFLHNKSKDFRTLTSDDAQDALFIATSNTIEEYSLLTFNFSKQHNFDKENIYSLRFSSNANQFGLTIGKCHERKWYFEVENRSMIRRCSVVTPIEYGSCLVSILFNYNQWTIVNNHGDILFQVNNSGQIKAEIVYGGRNSLNAIEKKIVYHSNIWIFRTTRIVRHF
ncbi:unnamed protein product [Rotaria magnacalcarata]